MLSGQAEAGHASRLDSLPVAMNLKNLSVHGGGDFRIDEGCHPPRMILIPSRHIGLTFFSQDDDQVEETFLALVEINAELVALGETRNPTFDAVSRQGLGDKLDAGPSEEADHPRIKYDAYMSRMRLLQDEAVHDGYVLNLASEIDFRQFVWSAPDIRKGNLVLMDNGNLRAIWKDEQARLGLQFLGGRMVQYVIFKRRKQGQPISRVTGRDSLEGLKRQIDAFELYTLLYE